MAVSATGAFGGPSLKRTARKALDRWIDAMVGKVFACKGAMRLLATSTMAGPRAAEGEGALKRRATL